jgi:hypothetical protein
MTTYIQQLENIIRDMQIALPKPDYLPWLHFLHEIYPESELLRVEDSGLPQAREPTVEEASIRIKECNDVREIMMLAEQNGYPTWRIYPHREDHSIQEQEPVLFPTDKIQTVSSHALEGLFKKYLLSLEGRGMTSDGILIKGDNHIIDTDGETRICLVFRPSEVA